MKKPELETPELVDKKTKLKVEGVLRGGVDVSVPYLQ